jgi:hypothetical protein
MSRRQLRLITFHYSRWYERYPWDRPLDPAAKQTPEPHRESSPAAGSSGSEPSVDDDRAMLSTADGTGGTVNRPSGPLAFHVGRRVA